MNPWEKYSSTAVAEEEGPWSKYGVIPEQEEAPQEASLGSRIAQRVSEIPQRYEKAKETSGGGFLGPLNAAAGEGFRAAGDVTGIAFEPLTKALVPKSLMSRLPNTPGIKQASETLPESVKYNLGTSALAAGTVLGAGPGLKVAKEAVKLGQEAKVGLGEKLLASGKSSLQSGMKPKDVTSKLAGKNVMEGAQNLIDRVDKYNLESPIGGFKGIAVKAENRIAQEKEIADNLIKDYAVKNPTVTHDIDKSFINYIDDLQKGKFKEVFGDDKLAAKYASDIHEALALRGLDGMQPISKFPEIKQLIENYGGGLFPKGSQAIGKDPLKLRTGELAYLRLKGDLESYIPEIADHNHAIYELIPVERAANEAVKRIGNKNKIGLEDWALLFGGPGAAHTLGASGLSAVAVIPGAILMGKKALSGGRGASAMIKAGKLIKGNEKPTPNLSLHTAAEKVAIGNEMRTITPEVHTFRNAPIFQKSLEGKERLALPMGKERLTLPDRSSKQLEPPGKYTNKEPGFTMPHERQVQRDFKHNINSGNIASNATLRDRIKTVYPGISEKEINDMIMKLAKIKQK